jgi:hypothetical protein
MSMCIFRMPQYNKNKYMQTKHSVVCHDQVYRKIKQNLEQVPGLYEAKRWGG